MGASHTTQQLDDKAPARDKPVRSLMIYLEEANMDDIITRHISANGLSFETDISGKGDRFALLLHGFPENKYSWRFQLPMLANLGYTAWAPNLRGYGQSTRPQGRAAYDLAFLAQDVAGLIAAAKQEREYKEVVLIGHDWGGAIAWAVAIQNYAHLDKLIIANVPHPALFRQYVATPTQLRRSWYIFFMQMPWLAEFYLGADGAKRIGRAFYEMAVDKTNFSDTDLAVFQNAAQDPGALTAMLNYYRANLFSKSAQQISAPYVAPIEVPTLMIWGERDTALGKELTYGTERYVRQLTMRYLPNASHWVQQECPKVFNALLKAYLLNEKVLRADEIQRTFIA